jgi:hypothetical protein
LNGIEFAPPKKITMRAMYKAFHAIHPAMFGQVVVIRMYGALELRTLVRRALHRMENQKIQAIGGPAIQICWSFEIYFAPQPHSRAWRFFAGLVLFE